MLVFLKKLTLDLFNSSSQLPNSILNMSVFKTIIVVCAVLDACTSYSDSHMAPSSNDQGSQTEVSGTGDGGHMMTSQMSSLVSQIQQTISDSQVLSAGQPEPRPGAEQTRPGAAPAVTTAAPTTTQYLCSCITIKPLTTPHHTPSFASAMTDSFTSAEASAAQSAPAATPSCLSGLNSAHSSDGCADQHDVQSSPAQEQPQSDNRGSSHPAYAANNGGY